MITKFILEELLNFNGTVNEFLIDLTSTKRKMYLKFRHPGIKFKDYRKYKNSELFTSREKQKLHNLICKLKRGGFIETNNKLLKITNLGKNKIEKLRKFIRLPKKNYLATPIDEKIIFIFDIPEKQKHLRNWLRMCLIGMGFLKLQKSVWMGNIKLPKDFLKDITNLDLEEYIHIFKVTKEGTL